MRAAAQSLRGGRQGITRDKDPENRADVGRRGQSVDRCQTSQARRPPTSTRRLHCRGLRGRAARRSSARSGPRRRGAERSHDRPREGQRSRADDFQRSLLLVFFSIAGDARERSGDCADGNRPCAEARAIRSRRSCSKPAMLPISLAMTIRRAAIGLRAPASDPNGPIGKAAAKAIEMLGVTPTLKTEPDPDEAR